MSAEQSTGICPVYIYKYITNPTPNKFNSIININRSQTKLFKFKKFFYYIHIPSYQEGLEIWLTI